MFFVFLLHNGALLVISEGIPKHGGKDAKEHKTIPASLFHSPQLFVEVALPLEILYDRPSERCEALRARPLCVAGDGIATLPFASTFLMPHAA